jgi:hypothetical protein
VRLLLLAVAVLVAAVFAMPAYGWYAPTFNLHLPTPVPTYCPESQAEFTHDAVEFFGHDAVYGWTHMPTGEISLGLDVCQALAAGPRHRDFPIAAAVLYHEWVHSYFREMGDAAEGNAECVSLHFYRYALVNFWGTTRAYAEKAYKIAWRVHTWRKLVSPWYVGFCDK